MPRWGSAWVVAVLAVALVACGGGSDEGASTTEVSGVEVALEMAGATGDDPFAESVAIDETAEFPDAVAATISATAATFEPDAATGGVTTTAATPGLYGGSQDEAVCDVEQLTAFLTDPANADKATAFTSTLGISMEDLAGGFLSALTPVVLTTDTLVTNHGFRNGQANAFPAVLQAGTAVLVDGAGVPRVKCNCGNPLNPPPADVDLGATAGDPWPGYTAGTTTTITAAPDALPQLTVVDTTTGDTYQQAAGAGSSGTAIDLQDNELVILDDAGDEVSRVPYDSPGNEISDAVTSVLGDPDDVVDVPGDDICVPPHQLSSWGGLHLYDQPPTSGGGRGLYLFVDAPDVPVTGYGFTLGQPLSDVLGHPSGREGGYENQDTGIDVDGDEVGVAFSGFADGVTTSTIARMTAPTFVGLLLGDC